MESPVLYEIRVQDFLGNSWATWFEDLSICHEGDGATLLCGALDQAALHGVLMRIRDLGLPLLSVQRLEGNQQIHKRDKRRKQ